MDLRTPALPRVVPPRLLDACLALVLALAGGLSGLNVGALGGHDPWVAVAVLIAMGLVLYPRRRYPEVVLTAEAAGVGVMVALGVKLDAAFLSVLVSSYSARRVRQPSHRPGSARGDGGGRGGDRDTHHVQRGQRGAGAGPRANPHRRRGRVGRRAGDPPPVRAAGHGGARARGASDGAVRGGRTGQRRVPHVVLRAGDQLKRRDRPGPRQFAARRAWRHGCD